MAKAAPLRAIGACHLLGLGVFGLRELGRILFGAMVGTGRLTPLASGGATGAELPEMLVGFLLMSLSLAALIAAGLPIWGLVRRP